MQKVEAQTNQLLLVQLILLVKTGNEWVMPACGFFIPLNKDNDSTFVFLLACYIMITMYSCIYFPVDT